MGTLFTPLGLNYGYLYSAVVLLRPSRVIVVTSHEAAVNLYPALDAARFFHSRFDVEVHELADPLSGFNESRHMARVLAAKAGEENTVNLTGGTTVLLDCVRSVADVLREQGKPLREVAVIDRRPMDEQRRFPLVTGELVEVPRV